MAMTLSLKMVALAAIVMGAIGVAPSKALAYQRGSCGFERIVYIAPQARFYRANWHRHSRWSHQGSRYSHRGYDRAGRKICSITPWR